MPDPLVAVLRAAGCVFAVDEAVVLRRAEAEGGDLDAMLARRVAGEPLEQVVGWVDFCGLRICTAPGVFVPRQNSARLVELAVRAIGRRQHAVVVDLCCGTGALGVSVLARRPACELHAADIDPAAVACARRNLAGAGHVHEGDLFDALPGSLRGRCDVVVANAPYVPTDEIDLMPPEARLHERRVALDGGADGTVLHRRIARDARQWLAAGGSVLIEAGSRQAAITAAHCRDAGLETEILGDDVQRVVRGRFRPPPSGLAE